jgi:RNA polymerase sigma-70 factor (ECF subfamily)
MPAGADSSDEDLMLAYAAGDAAAFDAIYARHKGGVYRYLLRQCRDVGIAEQLFQDVWMNLIRVRTTYQPSAKFNTWLYTLAHNRLVDYTAPADASRWSPPMTKTMPMLSPRCPQAAGPNRNRARPTASSASG